MNSQVFQTYPEFIHATGKMYTANHHARGPTPVNIQSEKHIGEPIPHEGLLHWSLQTISHSLSQLQILGFIEIFLIPNVIRIRPFYAIVCSPG